MSTILKEDVLRGKNREISNKEKVDKIMSTIVETAKVSNLAKTEGTERKMAPDIFSCGILIEGERQSDLDDLRNRVRRELAPADEIEAIITDRIVSSVWRLKRCLKIESLIMDNDASGIQEYEQRFFCTRKRTDKELTQLKAVKMIENKNRIMEVSKYETMLETQIYKALRELNKYRRRESIQEKRTLRKTK